MLSPRLNNCPECADIPSLLKKIDCKLAELGNNLYNNISYMLNKPVPAVEILQLIGYRRILTYKYCNPNYVHKYSVKMIASRVIRLTLGCVSRCNEPERCLEEPCDIIIVPNPVRTTTTTTTLPITTTTTSTSSTSTTTSSTSSTTTSTTTICQDCIQHDVTIGTQVWAGCNLDVTTYRNGDPIPEVTNQAAWESLTTGAWCYYNNDPLNGPTYGKIYNWYAVNDPRGLAPAGYDVPTDPEWTTLVNYLGGDTVAGGHLKEQGFCHWASPNTGADNSSGFTALPSGRRRLLTLPEFELITYATSFWTSTPNFGGADGYAYQLGFSDILAIRGFYASANGFSVRCIKNTGSTTTTSSTSTSSTTTSTTTLIPISTTTTTSSSSSTTTTTTIPSTSTTTSTSSSTSTTTSTSSSTTTTTTTIAPVAFGLMYNWYAARDSRNIAAIGWEVPTIFDYQTLADYLGAAGNYNTNTVGGRLKEIGLTYWLTPNTGAINDVGFNGKGSGVRNVTFTTKEANCNFWTTSEIFPNIGGASQLYSNSAAFGCASNVGYVSTVGYSIRLKKITTTLTNGQTGTYVGNDGRVYRTICIGTQEWVADDICETRFRNLDIVPYNGLDNPNNFTDAEWAVLSTAGTCAYNNDVNNVAPGFSFPAP